MSLSFATACLLAIFLAIGIGYIVIMRSILRVNSGVKKMRNILAHPDRTPPISHLQWEVREKLTKEIIERAKEKFPDWTAEKRSKLDMHDSKTYFDMRVGAFMENVHTRSDMDIPPFFASILGMDELQGIIMTHEKEIVSASISVMMGASCLFDPRSRSI
jgi:hypothetical protein